MLRFCITIANEKVLKQQNHLKKQTSLRVVLGFKIADFETQNCIENFRKKLSISVVLDTFFKNKN